MQPKITLKIRCICYIYYILISKNIIVFRYFRWEVLLYREIEFSIVKLFTKGVAMFFSLTKGKPLFLDISDGNLSSKVKLNFPSLEALHKKNVCMFLALLFP